MMGCHDIDELKVEYLYQELDAEQAEALRSHVEGCARCAAEIRSLERTRLALRALPELEPSPAVSARLLHEAAKRASRAEAGGVLDWLHRLFGPLVAHPAWAAAASLLLVAGVAGFLSMRGKVSEHAQRVGPAAETAASTLAPAPPQPEPATPAGAAAPVAHDQLAADEKRPADKPEKAEGSKDTAPAVRDLGESSPAGYTPKVPAPAVAKSSTPKAGPREEDALATKRMGRTASADEVLGLAEARAKEGPVASEKKRAKELVDDQDIAASAPPPSDREQAGQGTGKGDLSAAASGAQNQLRKEPLASPQRQTTQAPGTTRPDHAASGERRAAAGGAQPSAPAPSMPPPAAAPAAEPQSPPAESPSQSTEGARQQIASKSAQAEGKVKEAPEQGLLREAQKQASIGRCDQALGIGQKIARMNPEFYRKRVLGDAALRACEEQSKQQQRAPTRANKPAALESESVDAKTAK